MASKLDGIHNWAELGRKAHYLLKEMAAGCGLTPRRLQQQAHAGRRPHCWLRHLRLRDAQLLLLKGSTNQEVSYQLGYGNPASFCNAFTDALGRSPQEFVRQYHDGATHLLPKSCISQNRNRCVLLALRKARKNTRAQQSLL